MSPRAIAVVINDGAVVVMHRVKEGSAYYTLPGGSVEDDESIADACVRELREETGLDGRVVRRLMTLDNSGRAEHYFLVAAEHDELYLGEPEAARTSASNRYTPMWLPANQLTRVDLRPEAARLMLLRLSGDR
jgi:8-oxo-dGTP diphosphatase